LRLWGYLLCPGKIKINKGAIKMKSYVKDCPRFDHSEIVNKDGAEVVNCNLCGYRKGQKCLARIDQGRIKSVPK